MKTIAIVEDNPDNLLLLQVLLDGQFNLHEYQTGEDAVAGIIAGPPDLVLMDISLPGMNGCVALQQLRSRDSLKSLPVIALTANAMIGDKEKFLEGGFDDYVSKPILDPEHLLAPIRALLAQ